MQISTDRRVPFNKVVSWEMELARLGGLVANDNERVASSYTVACQEALREATAALAVYMTPSCTQSLEMAALLAGLGPGDEVIMPAFTFASTANAIVLRGATPVFVDIRPDTCNLDESLVAPAITPKTRAIVPVHYAGVACEMGTIMSIAEDAGLYVFEDAAHAVFARWKGRALGSIGHMGAYSFHSTKNLTSGGQGGALLVNTPSLIPQADIVYENGTNRGAFVRGAVPYYEWIRLGGNYNMSEVQAVVLSMQLLQGADLTASRVASWTYYYEKLSAGCEEYGVALPVIPDYCQHNAHIFYLRMPTRDVRQAVMARLASAGIEAPSHYEPLHSSPAGHAYGRFNGMDKWTTKVASTIMRLPLYHGISKDDQDYVIASLLAALEDVIGSSARTSVDS